MQGNRDFFYLQSEKSHLLWNNLSLSEMSKQRPPKRQKRDINIWLLQRLFVPLHRDNKISSNYGKTN